MTISVLGLEAAAGAPEPVAAAVTEALRQRVTTTAGFRLIPGRDLVEVKLVFSCPDEAPPCMTQAAQSVGAGKLIFGNVQPVGMDAYLVTLKILDAERGVVEAWISEQIAKTQTTSALLRVPVQKWFASLTGLALPGTLKITGGVIGATVWLDGTQAGLLGADGLTMAGVTAGPHQVVVSKSGYEKFDRNVTIASGAVEKLHLQLKPIGVAGLPERTTSGPHAEVDVTPAASTESAAERPNQAFRVTAWALLGLSLATGGLGIYSSWKVNDVNNKLDPYRRFKCGTTTEPDQQCGIDGKVAFPLTEGEIKYVNDQQSIGDTYSTIQWLGYSVGGVALAASAVFFYYGYIGAPSSGTAATRPSWAFVPTVGPSSTSGTLYVRF